MAYCGYVDISIVIIFIVLFFLILLVGCGMIIFIRNIGVLIVSWKILVVNIFLDLEILLTMWNILFLVIVLIIRRSVLIFSFAYIRGYRVSNFIFLYISFIIRMVWLILNNNFYWMMLGWDGLGVVSFLLIVYYINNERVNNGLFTLFQNRLGDLFFVIFILGNLNLLIWNNEIISRGLVVLILGACVKRAQFPFNAWLLAAIRAPTPISSLVHSSTLVVAGVFILLQYNYCLIENLEILKFIRIFTLIIRMFGLLNEVDIKKLIAYSTISHVSLIIYIIRFKLFKIVYFHLNIHAMFKSLIFICFGFVMLISFHSQDKRLVSYSSLNPVIKIIYMFSCLCLAGLPILRGFFSKDLIIEKIIDISLESIYVIGLLLFLRVRIYYSIKLLMLNKIIFVYSIVEKNWIRIWGVIVIMIIIILITNVYLSLVFRLSLELFSFKISIYLLIILFFLCSINTNWGYKIIFYSKVLNFKEVWCIKYIMIDTYVYWNIIVFINQIRVLSKVKLLLLINWWVMVIFILIIYEKSFKSVALKKLRFLSYFLWCLAYIISVNKV